MKSYTADTYLSTASTKFNNRYIYQVNDPYKHNEKQLIVCPDHGEFIITGHSHLNSKYGCPQCGNEYRSLKIRERNTKSKKNWNHIKSELIEMYDNRYIFPDKFEGSVQDKVDVECPIHGIFSKHLFVLLQNKRPHQCQKCRHESTKTYMYKISTEQRNCTSRVNRINANKKRKLNFNDAVNRFKAVHGDKFEYYESSYAGISKVISFICPKHGEVSMLGKEHEVSKHGCPKCAINNKSKVEELWLNNFNISIKQHRIMLQDGKMVIVDGYDSETNTVYEFLGDFWHGHPSWHDKFNGINQRNGISFINLFESTKIRFQNLYELGYNICYLWENDYNYGKLSKRIYSGKLEC